KGWLIGTQVAGHEEVQPVANARSAERASVLLLLMGGYGHRHTVRIGAHEILVLHVAEYRPVKQVGAGLGDRVDQAADEAALPHVERRREDLILLHRLDREGARVHAATGNLIACAQREESVVD